MSRQSKTPEEYREAWEGHLKQFTCVLFEAGIPVAEWDAITAPMYNAIDKAVAKLEGQGIWVRQWDHLMNPYKGEDDE